MSANRRTVMEVFGRVDWLLSEAEDALSALLYVGADKEIPKAYREADRAYNEIEKLRRRLIGRR